MADEKRERAWNDSKNEWIASLPDASLVTAKESGCFNDGWFRGYAAGVAEGIPQGTLDGYDAALAAARSEWKAIETDAENLPKSVGRYVTLNHLGNYEVEAFHGSRTIWWLEHIVAYQREPQPYQRQSREGDSK